VHEPEAGDPAARADLDDVERAAGRRDDGALGADLGADRVRADLEGVSAGAGDGLGLDRRLGGESAYRFVISHVVNLHASA